MRIEVNDGIGKSSRVILNATDDDLELIDLNEIYKKLIISKKVWRLEIYEK